MFKQLFDMLQANEHHAISDVIDFAKGKYSKPTSRKEKKEQSKRMKAWQSKKK